MKSSVSCLTKPLQFGNDLNDIKMLTMIGIGVTMGSAHNEVKQTTKMVKLSDEDSAI